MDKTHVACCSNDASKIKFIMEAFCPSTFLGNKNHLKVYKSESMWKSETHCTIAGLNPGLICFL